MFQVQETYLKSLLVLCPSKSLQPRHTINIKKYKLIYLNSTLSAMCGEVCGV